MNLVIPDHPWSEKGASLRISMTGAKKGHGEGKLGQIVTEVKSDNLEDPSESIHFKWHLGQISGHAKLITYSSPNSRMTFST